jgi:hypothetical protein
MPRLLKELVDRGSPRIDMHGRSEPDRSVPPEADKPARGGQVGKVA